MTTTAWKSLVATCVAAGADPGGLEGAVAPPPYFHGERQPMTNESAAKIKSRVIYRVCAGTYVAISVVRFNNEETWATKILRAYARDFYSFSSPFNILRPLLLLYLACSVLSQQFQPQSFKLGALC